jgi:hypothetical protein
MQLGYEDWVINAQMVMADSVEESTVRVDVRLWVQRGSADERGTCGVGTSSNRW